MKLKFVEVFIKESSKNYNKLFQQYYILREELIQQYNKSFWVDFVSEYLHALRTEDIELKEFLCQYECYFNRQDAQRTLNLGEY